MNHLNPLCHYRKGPQQLHLVSIIVKQKASLKEPFLAKPVVSTTKKPPATSRNVQMAPCDDSAITAVDDQTLQGIIIVQDCPCEARYNSNASRIAAVSAEVTTQLNQYMTQTHGSKVNYQCKVQDVAGNGTYTKFQYTCAVPKADHDHAKLGMQQCCTNDQVNEPLIEIFFLLPYH
jgi:hypothetical protein